MAKTADQSARDRIRQLAQEIIRQPCSDEVKQEVWRIMKVVNTDRSLNDIHDKALDLKVVDIDSEISAKLRDIMAVARYGFGVLLQPNKESRDW